MPGKRGDTDGTNKPVRKSGAVGEVDNAEFRGFINVNLSDEQKELYVSWATEETLRDAADYQVTSGVNLSLKRERKVGGFLATATQRDPRSPNAGLCVTARGKTAATAWGRVLFILSVLSEFERWEDTQPLANADRW